ncbi:hypothetical protein [Solitalea lacus]|uniref:hypothetical protein n=1 Tax=Solitalea lacus TaxID=2911172 RepID=UPI001EDAC577|nr:hypothetical protein [Solitalea lacus]UKJ08111.1 hypothetical protein L2B55_02835 [Solitalea lacus]
MKKLGTIISRIKVAGFLSIVILASSCANELKFVRVKSTESMHAQKAQNEQKSEDVHPQGAQYIEQEIKTTTVYSAPDGSAETTESLTGESNTTTTRQLVRTEMSKNEAFNKLSVTQQEKVEKLIAKRVDKVVAKKKTAPAPAPSVEFTRIMLIGLIILLAGIILGAIVGGLGWVAFVVGLGLIVYGLIVQL